LWISVQGQIQITLGLLSVSVSDTCPPIFQFQIVAAHSTVAECKPERETSRRNVNSQVPRDSDEGMQPEQATAKLKSFLSLPRNQNTRCMNPIHRNSSYSSL
jgi:hypothetical protein